MDITQATALASAIVALAAPAIIQAVKGYIPQRYVPLTSLAVSVVLGALAVAATGGFTHSGWGVVLAAVVGVAQAVYAAINTAANGRLGKTAVDAARAEAEVRAEAAAVAKVEAEAKAGEPTTPAVTAEATQADA